MSQGDGVSWQVVEQIVRDWLGSHVRLDEITLLEGGVVHTTVKVKANDGSAAVLQLSQHRVNPTHAMEARELELLRGVGVPVPKVLRSNVGSLESPHSYMLMEFVDGISLRDLKQDMPDADLDYFQTQLAEIVLAMHAHTSGTFGKFEGDAFSTWPDFYRSLVDPVLGEADKLRALPGKVQKTIHKVHDKLESLVAHSDVPRLLHGDLWSANILCRQDAQGRWAVAAIIDPELRFGHFEAELAYLDLFRTIGQPFKKVYGTSMSLGDDYHRVRKPVYQLYGLINQLQLQGPHYAQPVIEAAEKLNAIV
jgi:fructosamine-3-kinase